MDPSIDDLRAALLGELLTPGDAEYDTARRVVNTRVDRRPAAIARCAHVPDVVAAVRHCRARGLTIAVRGGGHHVAGWATCDDGLVVDLGQMSEVTVDAARKVAVVGPGARWGRFDAATLALGLAAPGGRNPGVGVAGYTLGGGIGELSRMHGLGCDNVCSFQVVTADGAVVTADADYHPELFWALRGGGGNFGVVTRFDYRLHPVAPMLGGPLVFAAEHAADAVLAARDWVAELPRCASVVAMLWTAPPGPLVPPEWRLRRCAVLVPTWFGASAEGATAMARLRRAAPTASADGIGELTYGAYQRLFAGTGSVQLHSRAELLGRLPDSLVEGLVERWAEAGPGMFVLLGPLGGAIADVPSIGSAFAHRDATWFVEAGTQRPGVLDAAELLPVLQVLRLLEGVSRGPYVNQLPDSDPDALLAAYGSINLKRLRAVKRQYDPDNVFRLNANIAPA